MSPISIFGALIAVLLALATAWLTGLFRSKDAKPMKFQSIEGLRGYLAFFVFLNHSAAWYFYLRTKEWHNPPSSLFSHFADYSVAMFFMITGFLFFSKLIHAKTKPIDWLRFFVSRILRLTPLYIFALLSALVIVAVLSGFALAEPAKKVVYEIYKWSPFSILGAPAINAVTDTGFLLGVTWSLRYEWLFYFSLPVIGALFFKAKGSIPMLVFTALVIAWIVYHIYPVAYHIYSFFGGIAAAFLVKSEKITTFASGIISSLVILLCLILSVVFFPGSQELIALSLLSIAFILIACGNNLFGALTNKASRLLGDMAYSIYLLHSMMLYITIKFIFGWDRAAALSPMQHWLMIWGCAVGVVLVCSITYRFIELPGMNAVAKVTTTYRNKINTIRQLFQSKRATN